MDCSPPGSSVHGISQARILEWVASSFSIFISHHIQNIKYSITAHTQKDTISNVPENLITVLYNTQNIMPYNGQKNEYEFQSYREKS